MHCRIGRSDDYPVRAHEIFYSGALLQKFRIADVIERRLGLVIDQVGHPFMSADRDGALGRNDTIFIEIFSYFVSDRKYCTYVG